MPLPQMIPFVTTALLRLFLPLPTVPTYPPLLTTFPVRWTAFDTPPFVHGYLPACRSYCTTLLYLRLWWLRSTVFYTVIPAIPVLRYVSLCSSTVGCSRWILLLLPLRILITRF